MHTSVTTSHNARMALDAPRFDLIGTPGKGALGFDPSAAFSGFGAAPKAPAAAETEQDADTQEGDNGSD